MNADSRVRRNWGQVVWNSEGLKWLLIISNLFLFMLHVWGLTLFRSHVDYQRAGTLAEWFTGLLTLGAVSVAALALRRDRRKYETERLRMEAAEIAAANKESARAKLNIRAAASTVYCWILPSWDYTGQRLEQLECHIENRTPVPVYEWVINIEHSDRMLKSEAVGPVVPGHTTIPLKQPQWLTLVQNGIAPRSQMTFRASNGELLRRDFDGGLVRVEST
jgi:hypothetical protein